MRFRHAHLIDTDVDQFWQTFFDPDFNRALYLDHLQYASYKVVADRTGLDGTRQRRVECVPKVDLPARARAFFGMRIGYTEVGYFDASARRYYTQVVPAYGCDTLTMTSELWVEPDGAQRVRRVATGKVTVNLPKLTSDLEGLVKQQARDACAQSADFINRWLRDGS